MVIKKKVKLRNEITRMNGSGGAIEIGSKKSVSGSGFGIVKRGSDTVVRFARD
jgi:hypothetical protein